MAHENLGEMFPLYMKTKNSKFQDIKNTYRSRKKRQLHLNATLVKDINRPFTKLEM